MSHRFEFRTILVPLLFLALDVSSDPALAKDRGTGKKVGERIEGHASRMTSGASDTCSSQLSETEKVEVLLRLVELSQETFVRNDQVYSGTEAAQHLRQKWEQAPAEVKTARDFVDRIASKSSVSGKPYAIRLADGEEFAARVWLLGALAMLESLPEFGAPDLAATTHEASSPSGADEVLDLLRKSDLTFLRVESDEVEHRNGKNMARHIALKYLFGGRPELDADGFIDRFCTKSSLHNTHYLVELADGTRVRLDKWLREQLSGSLPQSATPHSSADRQ